MIGLAIIALGVLLAIYGPAEVLRLYFGIIACAIGGAFVVYGIFLLSKKLSVPSFAFIAGGALISIGVGFLIKQISTEIFKQLIMYGVLGIGSGLTLFGIYLIGRKVNAGSIINLAAGVVILTFAILDLTIDKFEKVFWIVIGILIAIYGLVSIVMLFVKKHDSEESKEKEKAVEVEVEEPKIEEPEIEESEDEEGE